ncbi:MAG TPA: S-layer homology domain-containing protein, partial [Clostridia bacterium]|nr:S-layer homology domain-containing protein [Clostridia bacterium]
GLTFMRTLSADPLSLSVSERTNTSLSYVIDSSNQTDGTDNKVILSNDGKLVSETAFGRDKFGKFDGLSEGTEYQIQTITRNSDAVENDPHLFWGGTTKHMPKGEIVFPNEDIYLKDGQTFTLEGTYEDDDGDDVAIEASIGGIAGDVNVGSTTWSAIWNLDGLPEGIQSGISVSLSDSGGREKTVINWIRDLTIDRTCPRSPEISTDPTGFTSGSVLVSISGEENASIFYSVDGNTALPYENAFLSHENAEIRAFQRDKAGNLSSESTIVINWIDKTEPSGSISYSTYLPTNEAVAATLTAIDENEVEITNNGGSSQYEFTTNGSFSFELRDVAGNTGSVAAHVTWIDALAPNSPSIHLSPESGISTDSVEISVKHEETEEELSIEYRIADGGEIEWLPYEAPFSVSEKGSWLVCARTVDKAGNTSLESGKRLILKNRRKKETVEPSSTVDHYDISLPYLVAEGTKMAKSAIGSFYDIDGNPIDMSGFELESSNPDILKVMEDGSIIAKNVGVVELTVSYPETGEVVKIEVEVEGPIERSSYIEFNDTKKHWAKDSITDISEAGYVCGYGDGSFRPQSNMTVAECLTIMERVRLDNSNISRLARPCQEPVINAEDWSRNYCLSAFSRMDMDEVNSAFGEKIDADVPVTRGQVAFLLAEGENWADAFEKEIPFTDIRDNQYLGPVLCAFEKGIFEGYPDKTFRPYACITRAEMTVLFNRYIKYLQNL